MQYSLGLLCSRNARRTKHAYSKMAAALERSARGARKEGTLSWGRRTRHPGPGNWTEKYSWEKHPTTEIYFTLEPVTGQVGAMSDLKRGNIDFNDAENTRDSGSHKFFSPPPRTKSTREQSKTKKSRVRKEHGVQGGIKLFRFSKTLYQFHYEGTLHLRNLQQMNINQFGSITMLWRFQVNYKFISW